MKRTSLSRFSIITLVVLCALSLMAVEPKQSSKLTLFETVTVDGTQLTPGEYQVHWSANGPDAQITVLRHGVQVLSTTGTVRQQKNAADTVTTHRNQNGSRVLEEISFSRVTILLVRPESSHGE